MDNLDRYPIKPFLFKKPDMQTIKKQLVLTKIDYEIIMSCLKKGVNRNTFNRKDGEELETEIKKAKLVTKEELPSDVVRLNSTVTIKDEINQKIMQVMVVTPDKANIKQMKISIMSPMGIALIGFRKGQKIKWQVPAGKKTFTILEVVNPGT